MKNNKKGFTLVELIVVITILSILGTIAFVSLGSYTRDARDSSRLSDIKLMMRSLENHIAKTGILPNTSSGVNITYSGSTIFTQGVFGLQTLRELNSINKAPVDPLYDNYYSYSVSSTKREYNLAYIQEGIDLVYNGSIGKTANAETVTRELIGRVKGNYNGQIVHTGTGGRIYVFAIPSLILTDLSETDLLSIGDDKVVYDDVGNVPASYSSGENQVVTLSKFLFTPKMVFSGSTLPSTPAALSILVKGVKSSITGTVLYSDDKYKDLIEMDANDISDLEIYGKNYILNSLGGRFNLSYPSSCVQIMGTEDNRGSGFYTISGNGTAKINAYCDMETDGGGWTRIKNWDKNGGYLEGSDINKTKGISGSEVMVLYTRFGKIRDNIGGTWTDVDVSGKQYGIYYKKFSTKQTQETGECGEHTTINDLADQLAGGTWGDCSRSCYRSDPANPNSSCDGSLENTDIILDELGVVNPLITGDKMIAGFEDDPCINDGHKTTDRNVSWSSDGRVTHRIDSATSLISLGGGSSGRCDGAVWSENWLIDRGSSRLSARGITNPTEYQSGFQSTQIYVR